MSELWIFLHHCAQVKNFNQWAKLLSGRSQRWAPMLVAIARTWTRDNHTYHTIHCITLHYITYIYVCKKALKTIFAETLYTMAGFTMPEIVHHLSLVVQTFIYKIVKNQVAFGGAQLEHHRPHESLKCYHLVMAHFVRENLKMFRDGDQASYPNSKSSRKKTRHLVIWLTWTPIYDSSYYLNRHWNTWKNSETKRWPTGTNNCTPELLSLSSFGFPKMRCPWKSSGVLRERNKTIHDDFF